MNRNALLAKLSRSAIMLGLIGCSPNSSSAQSSATQMYAQNEAELGKIVVEYVQKTRGWSNDSYSVQLNGRDGEMLVFWVIFKGDDIRIPGGGGKSFEALVDPKTRHVEKELRFQ
ncbi:MAG TPA: hypothetical protein VII49_12650 [Rhizomicrobium sp.]